MVDAIRSTPDGLPREPVLASMAGAERDEALAKRVDELAALYRLTDRLYRASSLAENYDAALEAIVAALGCNRASILLFDESGVMRFVAWRGLSDAYRKELEGHSPWKPGERNASPIFVADIVDTDEPDWIKKRIAAEGIRGLAFIPLAVKGEVVGKFMTYYPEPHAFTRQETDIAVTIARQVGFGLERARAEKARQEAEAALRESEERFRLMSEHAPVMIWMSKPDGSCLHLNRMLREFWDVDEDAVDAFDWRVCIHPDDVDYVTHTLVDALAARRNVTLEARYRKAGEGFRVLFTDARPRFSQGGEFLGMIGVNVDIDERKASEAQRELLLAELNHRVKNTLAVVQGLAHQTFKDVAVTEPACKAFEGRLFALSTAHDLLTQANWESTSLADLAADTLQVRRGNEPRVTLAGQHVLLQPKQTLAIGMALHELYTNAVKYGALAGANGRVSLTWTVSGAKERHLNLIWQEECDGEIQPPVRRGFGSRLIASVVEHDLGGSAKVEFRPRGLSCVLDVPL
jgi:PAS domain S-box-containing protein